LDAGSAADEPYAAGRGGRVARRPVVPPPPAEPILRPKPALPAGKPQPDRELDPRFYRACYDDAAALSDADLLAAAASLPPERLRNPFEFIQHVLAQGLLPRDFDPLGYRINHPDLWGRDRADWEAALHFIKHRAAGAAPDVASWARPLDPEFYAALYLPHAGPADAGMLRDHRRKYPDAYGSLDEALVRNGWTGRDWVTGFDHLSYTVYNSLGEQLATPVQALVHFIEHGWRERLAVSAEAEFDPDYFTDLSGQPLAVSLEEAYRIWVEMGLAAKAPANEAAHLRAIGLDLPRFPESFDWRLYLEERPEVTAPPVLAEPEEPTEPHDPTDPDDPTAPTAPKAKIEPINPPEPPPRNRWTALKHLIDHGLLQGDMALPVAPTALPRLLLAAGDRFSIAQREDEAARCYERALLYPDPPLRLLRHAGDQALRHGHHARALAHYRRACATPAPGFWTWCNGARAALAVGELDEAAECVLGGLADFPRSGRLYDVLLEIQHARFNQAVARHFGALRADRSQTGLAAALDAILALFLRAHRASFGTDAAPPRPAGPRPANDGTLRVAVLANRDLPQCAFYRVDLKLLQIEAAGGAELQVFVLGEEDEFRCAAATADLALFYRVAASVEVLRSIAACRGMGVLTVYEIDDLVFDPAAFPEPLDAYDGAIDPAKHLELRAGVDFVRFAAASCDAAIASTEALAVALRALVRSGVCHVHRNGLSAALATFARAATPRPTVAPDAPVTLFYGSYTKAHGADFRDLLRPALHRLMTERPEVRLRVCGHVDAAELAWRFPGRVERIEPIDDRDAYLSQLLGVDINLAVLRPGPFNDCKSEIKWLEAAAFCVPSVVSDVTGYREMLVDGVHVVRVGPDPDAWHAALDALVQDPARRAVIGAAARDRALELYGLRPLGRALVTALRGMMRQVPPSPPADAGPIAEVAPAPTVAAAPRRARILLANVFFPPQSIGGATRVVRDQAAELLARYADRYDIGVLCGNDEDSPPYRIEAYAWSGIPVWSIGCPRREHMDWLAFDPAMADPVDAVLDRFQPHLVHAHCIQRLTATALERVAARGLPYVVTAHDAWWVSDHQFLVDQQHRLRMPWDSEVYESAQNPHTRADSWSRRLRLRGVLDGAAAVLVVSRSFADIYQRAGIARAVAVPNGLPGLPPLEPVAPTPGRVRLAHVGGAVPHKGYYLLRQALARGRYRNLEMLVTDHAVTPGEERAEVWGSTPVSVIGRVPQAQVGALYGRIDVLCAPSLWPESYGLVAREALHYGKWVIASNRGAIGEDVTPGRDGWVVDVTDPAALPRVLAEIDNNPDRYAQPPERGTPARGFADQVDEIAGVYDRVLPAWP
jgi:glycosyltransferase involved in cell wall biosynthesis